jgi:hypothetical protein
MLHAASVFILDWSIKENAFFVLHFSTFVSLLDIRKKGEHF